MQFALISQKTCPLKDSRVGIHCNRSHPSAPSSELVGAGDFTICLVNHLHVQ